MGFVDSLESQETVSNFPDSIVDFSMPTPYDDTLNINVTGADLFASVDSVSLSGISTANEEVFTVPSPIDDLTGLNITTDKDDK